MKILKTLILVFFIAISNSCAKFFQIINYSPSSKLKEVTYQTENVNSNYKFVYSDTTENLYLRKLRTDYKIDSLVENVNSDFDKVKIILNWTHNQWEHNGNNEPVKSDPVSILEEVKAGKKFRCVEFGIVSAGALKSVGIKARVLGLKTRDVEKVRHGAGHVVAEAYLNDLKKWVFIDAQLNVIPVLDGIPLNGVELRKAVIENRNKLKLINLSGELLDKDKANYLAFATKYLYFFDVSFDQRVGTGIDRKKVNGKPTLALVPYGVKNPTIFQRKYPINYCEYTNNLNDFYQIP